MYILRTPPLKLQFLPEILDELIARIIKFLREMFSVYYGEIICL